jgi:antitoxin component of RelBE/YafQ-DinJ toxin-antitoxin module
MTTQVVFKIDPKVKAKAMKRAKHIGIPFASYLRQAAEDFAEGKSGMGIVREEKFNAKSAKELRAALRDIEKGKNLVKFKNKKEMDDYLLSL